LVGSLNSDISYLITTVQAGYLDQMYAMVSLHNVYQLNFEGYTVNIAVGTEHTLMLVYHSRKPVFRPKMAIFQRAGMRKGGLPLPLAFQYLILMI
jgi:hypothetical protein